MMRAINLYRFPGETFTLRRQATAETHTALLIEALERLSPCVQPLAVELVVRSGDREQLWFDEDTDARAVAGLVSGEAPSWVNLEIESADAVERTVPVLDAGAILEAIAQATARVPTLNAEHTVTWNEFTMLAARVALHEPAQADKAEWLSVQADEGAATVPLENRRGELWVSGPVAPLLRTQPPLRLYALFQGGELMLRLSVHWDLLTNVGGPAGRRFLGILDDLCAHGWQRDFESA